MANLQLFIQPLVLGDIPDYTGLEYRQLLAALIDSEGILTLDALKVTPRGLGANMSVDVAAGNCLITCDTLQVANSYMELEDASQNVILPAPPASGTRTHLIVEQARDPQADAGSSYAAGPVVIEDTDGSGAVLPPSALPLASVGPVTPSTAQITADLITDLRAVATFPGGLLAAPATNGSNTNSANDPGTEVGINNVTVTVSRTSWVRLDWYAWCTNVGSATSAECKLRRTAGPVGGTGGTEISSAQTPFGGATSCNVSGTWVGTQNTGTQTYTETFIPHLGKAYMNGTAHAALMVATFLGAA